MSQFQLSLWENCKSTARLYYISPEKFFSGYLAVAVVNITLALSAVFLNSVTIIVFYGAKKLETVTVIFMCSLAVTDVVTGLLGMTSFAALSLMRAYGKHAPCEFFLVGMLTRLLCQLLTCVTTTFLSLDRYVAIFHSYRYQSCCDDHVFAVKVLVVSWSTCILLAIGSFGTKNLLLLVVTLRVFMAASLPFNIWVHLRAFFAARRTNRQIQQQAVQVQEEKKRTRTKDLKAAKLTAVILVTILVCYLPALITGSLVSHFGHSESIYKAFLWANTLVMANSVCNPLAYGWQLKWFRKAFKKVFFKKNAQ